jgi:hypothetical protein
MDRYVQFEVQAYAAALAERAIPAEQALRLAMEYVNAIRQKGSPRFDYDRLFGALEAIRANPMTAKMLEE